MTTLANLFLDARALLNKYTDEGTMIPDDDVIDMQKQFIRFANMAHKELYEIARIDDTQEEPSELEALTDTTEVNYKADLAITYKGASLLATSKKKELVVFFDDMYEEQKKRCRNKASAVAITDVYSGEEE